MRGHSQKDISLPHLSANKTFQSVSKQPENNAGPQKDNMGIKYELQKNDKNLRRPNYSNLGIHTNSAVRV